MGYTDPVYLVLLDDKTPSAVADGRARIARRAKGWWKLSHIITLRDNFFTDG
jgi:hypothetical protein